MGVEQATSLRSRLTGVGFDQVHSSPLLRALETTSLAYPAALPRSEPALRELESVSGPTFIDTSDPEALAALLARPAHPSESGPAFMRRVSGWLATLPSSGSILVVSHFAVLREILGALLGFRRAPQQIDFTALFRLEIVPDAPPGVLLWNDTEHLQRPDAPRI